MTTKHQMNSMTNKSIVGDLINFRGLVYSPINEQGVVFLFGKIAQDLNMYVEEIKTGFPDCIGRRFSGKGWERLRIEFEHKSSNFKAHKHDPSGCDLIVCWEHDWLACPVEVIALRDLILTLPNPQVLRPETAREVTNESALEESLNKLDAGVRATFKMVDGVIRGLSGDVWRKYGDKQVTYYSPKRVFVYLRFRKKKGVRLTIFTRSKSIPGVKQFDFERGGAKWGGITISSENQRAVVEKVVKQSFKRINAALAANENTGWFAENEDNDEES
jgi:hypothetical protein